MGGLTQVMHRTSDSSTGSMLVVEGCSTSLIHDMIDIYKCIIHYFNVVEERDKL